MIYKPNISTVSARYCTYLNNRIIRKVYHYVRNIWSIRDLTWLTVIW